MTTDLQSVVQYAFVNVAASQTDATFTMSPGGGTLVATAGKSLRVLSYSMIAGGTATSVTFNSKGAGAGTACTAAKALPISGIVSMAGNEYGHFQTKVGETLTVTTGTGATTGIDIAYVLV